MSFQSSLTPLVPIESDPIGSPHWFVISKGVVLDYLCTAAVTVIAIEEAELDIPLNLECP